MSRRLRWFSHGAASAVATKLDIAEHGADAGVTVLCETNAEHPDNERFARECEAWFEQRITRLSSAEYLDTWHVWEDRRYIAGIAGAPCTGALKKAPRIAFQRPDDVHVFGYTVDQPDVERAQRLREHHPELSLSFPLIDRGLDKAACIALVEGAGIRRPAMYELGFQNNNCIPCPKATSPNYWSAIRLHFRAEFDRMAALSRELGARLARIGEERVFIDEIPADWPTLNPIAPACDFLCHIAEQDMRAA